MSNLSHIPLCRLILPFIAGIISFLAAGVFFAPGIFFAFYGIVICFWLVFTIIRQQTFSHRWLFGFLSGCILFVSGYHISQNHYQKDDYHHFSNQGHGHGYLVLQITEEVSEKTNSFRIVARVREILHNDSVFKVRGRILLYLQKDSLAASLKFGDHLLIENHYQEIAAPKNPYQFNFQRFLANKNIFHQAYRRSDAWQHLDVNRGNFLKATSLQLRRSALDVFKQNRLAGDEYAVASALLFGYTEYLDEDLMQEYSGSGAMHLLSVSGLHVGIIYIAIKYLLSFLNGVKHGKIVKSFLTVLFIWFYAAITGFSPSVLRAGTMFTFLAIGQSLGRNTNIYNTLSGSAFLLLLYDPYLITQIGFQLSYLAVISIVALQPPMQSLIATKNKILEWVWSLTTVSIAAQLVTGPIALYYFDQFPNYFLITNLVVVPLSTLIIYLSIALLGFSAIPCIGEFLGTVVGYLVFAMNQSVKFIDALPYSTFSGVHISLFETLGVLAIALFFGRYFLLRKSRLHFIAGLVTVLLIAISISAGNIQALRNSKLIVYHVPGATAIEFTSGRNSIFLGCENVENNPRSKKFHIIPFRTNEGVNNTIYMRAPDANHAAYANLAVMRDNLVKLGNMHLFWLRADTPHGLVKPGVEMHYLIVSQNPRHDPAILLQTLQPAKVIIDSSNNRWTIRKWEEAATGFQVPIWVVSDRGAYLASLATFSGKE